MSILDRARDLILNPRVTWHEIKDEQVEPKDLFYNYAAPLALVPAVVGLIIITIIGIKLPSGGHVRAPFLEAFLGGAIGYGFNLLTVYVSAMIIRQLAKYFQSKADLNQTVKLAVYSMSPAWLVSVIALIPGLSLLTVLGAYGIYLFVLGLPTLLDTPNNKVALYAVISLTACLFVHIIFSLILVALVYGPLYMRMLA